MIGDSIAAWEGENQARDSIVGMDLASLHQELVASPDLLIVQDLDGVCIPLVKDPLTRVISAGYVHAAARLRDSFVVLTNGEHEGHRGVNRLVETALGDSEMARSQGLYLPGLAAGGVQLQDEFGNVTHPGVSEAEISFLASVPGRMKALMCSMLPALMPDLSDQELSVEVDLAVLDTQLSPTINLNHLFSRIPDDVQHQRRLQSMLESLMQQLMAMAVSEGLHDSFFLHVAPNLGRDPLGCERLKPSVKGDVGSTDIQFMLRGAIKEAGLLVLINRHIAAHTGTAPLGENFNVRTAPNDHEALLALCKQRIPPEQMPHLVGVGDTVTSTTNPSGEGWLRGGSDRGFLTLLQELGSTYGLPNRVVLVDSSGGEVDRPSLADGSLAGISDPEDPLHFDVCIPDGPEAYVNWFTGLSEARTELTS